MSPLNSKGLCALAFQCEPQFDFPLLRWNVTFRDTPKPKPRPPKPPSVRKEEKLVDIKFYILATITKIHSSPSIRYSY